MLKRTLARLAPNPSLPVIEPAVSQSASALRQLLTIESADVRKGPQYHSSQYTDMQLDDWATQIRLSDDISHARGQARAFYRRILRRLPSLLIHYKFHEIPPQEVRQSSLLHSFDLYTMPDSINEVLWRFISVFRNIRIFSRLLPNIFAIR